MSKKGKDVDLHSASHVQNTSNAHLRDWNWAARPFLAHCAQPAHTGLRSDSTTSHRQRQLAIGLHLRKPSLVDYYSFNRPRRDGWLSWPCWLTDSGRFTHKVVTRPAVSQVQDRESSPAKTGGRRSNHYATPPTTNRESRATVSKYATSIVNSTL